MSESRLSVEIVADLTNLQRGLQAGARQVEQATRNINTNTNATTRALAGAASSARTSGVAFTGLSRVMQDFAFGPAAIANNLEGLMADFRQLRQVSATTGQSLTQTLVASLMGGGGLSIAMGAVTLGMSAMSFGMQAWSRIFPSSEAEVKDFIDTLGQLEQAHLKGAQSAAEEIVKLDSLYRATQNTNLSYKERKKAVDELQQQYPQYFGNIKDETILAGKAGESYDRLKTAIIGAARARAAQDMLVKSQKEQLENEQKIVEFRKKQEQASAEAAKAATRAGSYNPYGGSTAGMAAALDIDNKRAIYQDNIQKLQNVNNRLKQKDLDLTKYIDTQTEKYGAETLTGVNKELDKAVKKKKEIFDIDKELRAKGLTGADVIPKGGFNGTLPEIPAMKFPETDTFWTEMNAFYNRVSMSMAEFNQQFFSLQQTFATSITDAFGSAFGALLAGGDGFDNLGNNILTSVGGFLSRFGDLLIQYALSSKAFAALTQALKIPGPHTIVAATALIGAGIALKGIGSAITSHVSGGGGGYGTSFGSKGVPAFAMGVDNFKGGLALVGERGPELVNLPTGSDVIPNHMTRNYLAGSRSNSQVVVAPTIEFGYDKISVGIKKYEKSNSRS